MQLPAADKAENPEIIVVTGINTALSSVEEV